MPEQCQHYTPTGVLSQRRCTRQATKDGYCTRHHPSYVAPSQVRALEEWDREQAKRQQAAQNQADN